MKHVRKLIQVSKGQSLKTEFIAKMERKFKNLELKKSGNYCFYLCEFLSSKFNLLCFFFSLCGYHWFRLVRVRVDTGIKIT
jgi:hypothetical protein